MKIYNKRRVNSFKLIKNFASLSIVQGVNYIFPLLTVPYISRIIGPEGYGYINYSTAFVSYFILLVTYGFDLTGTRKLARIESTDQKAINRIVSNVLTARFLLFLVSVILFIGFLLFFEPIKKYTEVTIILFASCFAAVFSPQFIFQGFQDLTVFAKSNFIRGILNTILVFLLIKKPDDYIILAVLNSFFILIINILLFCFALYRFKIKLRFFSLVESIKLIIEEKMIFFSTVVISLYTTTNVVVLGFFVNTVDVGYYTTSHNFLNIVNSVIAVPLSTALFPFIGKAFTGSKEKGLLAVQKVLPIVAYLTLFSSLLLYFFAPMIIKLFYGNQFDNAILPLKIISFLPFIIGLSNIFGIQIMLNLGMDKLFFKVTFIVSVIGLVFNFYMSKNFGYLGTAWNIIIIESLVTFLMYIYLRKEGLKIIDFKYFKPKEIMSHFININKKI